MSSPASDVNEHSLLIRAGAGAGKTTTLIRTFIDFCHKFEAANRRLPRIAITTFTRKATQEVKERLSVKALEQKEERLFHHINKKSSVHISTIHGLLTLLVQENADVLGLPQTIKIVDQSIYKRSLRRMIRQCLKEQNKYLEILEHYSFVRVVDLVMLMLEGLRQEPLLKLVSKEELEKISAIKKEKLVAQLAQILEVRSEVPEAWGGYFAYLDKLRLLLSHGSVLDALTWIDEKPSKPRWNKKSPPYAESAHSLLEEFWEQMDLSFIDTPEYHNDHMHLGELFLQFGQEILKADNDRKLSTGEITINDLELFSLQLVRNHKDVVSDFSNKFDYYMIDEFQDTSPLQVEILDQIILGKPHFIVGDPQQSIYLFRGARSEVFHMKQQLAATGAGPLKLQFLDTNYRSQPSVMNFINDYFQHMNGEFEPMKTSPLKDATKSTVTFIQSDVEALGVLQHVSSLIGQGVSPKDICVLSRRNSNLVRITSMAQKFHIPVQLQISAGFDQKREILDLISMLKFLVNPHDNENLVLLLRSPWSFLRDEKISQLAKLDRSLWVSLSQNAKDLAVVQSLQKYFSNYQETGVSEAFMTFIKATSFLDFSSAYDSSGKREANFWKFFAHLKNAERNSGFSLGRYLSENFQFFQSDLGSSQSEAVPVAQPDRVSLMTIHASKGLEFPHVIVVGFSEQPQQTLQLPLMISLKEKKMSLAPFVISESKNAVSRWSLNHRQEFNELEKQEHERLLYVALTRAQSSLALVSETKSRQVANSWQKKSIWPEVGTHEHEFYNLVSLVTTEELAKLKRVDPIIPPISERLNVQSILQVSTSVTEAISKMNSGQATNYEQKVLDILKAKKGTDLHRLFESLQVASLKPGQIEQMKKTLKPEQAQAVNYLLTATDAPLKELLKEGHVEFGFGLQTKRGVLQGQIDLWGIVAGQIYILDYKTGSSAHSEKAYQQLSFYAHCLYKMNFLDFNMPLNFVVTYPLEQKTLIKRFSGFQDLKDKSSATITELFS